MLFQTHASPLSTSNTHGFKLTHSKHCVRLNIDLTTGPRVAGGRYVSTYVFPRLLFVIIKLYLDTNGISAAAFFFIFFSHFIQIYFFLFCF